MDTAKIPKHIAFVCLHGSAKSLIAAEYLNQRACEMGLDVAADSAGLEPDPEVPAHVVAGLRAKGMDVSGRTPAPASAAHLAKADRVVAFGCDLASSVKAGQAVEQWSDCPAVSDGFDPAWSYITRRVDEILAKLPAAKR
jgi:arsenate reductase